MVKQHKWEEFQTIYLRLMRLSDRKRWILFPNTFESVALLSKASNVAAATGNSRAGAGLKLGSFDLDQFFLCGGYGDKVLDRRDLVREAIEDAENYFKKRFDKRKIYLFGDTEKDMVSAFESGIIPVLIDHEKQNRIHAKKWKASYYGDFRTIMKFVSLINQDPEPDKVIVF